MKLIGYGKDLSESIKLYNRKQTCIKTQKSIWKQYLCKNVLEKDIHFIYKLAHVLALALLH